MIGWKEFIWFAIPAGLCWLIAGGLAFRKNKTILIDILMVFGIFILGGFIVVLWVQYERPPLRTMGETRLWYSFFLSLIGYVTYKNWKYNWLLAYTGVVACVFLIVNLTKPEIHNSNLMPALQSYWFVPHVTVYILSYSMFGAATIAALIQLLPFKKIKGKDGLFDFIDNMVYIGFGFIMLGLLMGAIWAKEAWGHYWSWDPKETWAFITVAAYLVYIHIRLQNRYKLFTLWLIPIAFILLMITWVGVNYLPAAQSSVHVYSS